MRPTFSIIFFTVMSGAGYGLWFLVGLGLVVRWPVCGARTLTDERGLAHALCGQPAALDPALMIGFILVSVGLVSSLVHLGQPQRAWRALSQWRSSWLSREGVAAIATYVPAIALIAIEWLAWVQAMHNPESMLPTRIAQAHHWMPALGGLLAIGSAATVFCTAHIYASLKPIRAWRNRYVVPGYLLIGLYGGALVAWLLATLAGAWSQHGATPMLAGVVLVAALCAWLKGLYWRDIDRDFEPDAGHAIGLESLGSVRSFEQPHTEENYLTHEMGFVLARKHSRKLRVIALLAGFLIPGLLALLGLVFPSTRAVAVWPALVCALLGMFVERWLFFAEAKHAVMGYYRR